MEGLAMNRDFWKGKRVFLTGHTGFKGSWISLWLQSLGAELTGFALPPHTEPSLFEKADVANGMRSINGDIRDLDVLMGAMKAAEPDIVIHMAAQALVRESYSSPLDTYSTNVMGTANVLEAIRNAPQVRAAVVVTTDKCYENREWCWGYREDDHLGGYDPYSSSKACTEIVTSAYRRSFFNPECHEQHRVAVASVRAGNVIGGGDWTPDRLIPDLLSFLGRGESIPLRNPHATRPWQHVLEPLSGYLTLAESLFTDNNGAYSEAWNFGPADEDARPVEWIVNKMTEFWGGGSTWVRVEQPQPHEASYLKLDCSKARSRLNWMPRWSLEMALAAIIDWHRAYLAGDDMRAATLTQIQDFESLSL